MKPSKASRKHIEAIKRASADDLKRYSPQPNPTEPMHSHHQRHDGGEFVCAFTKQRFPYVHSSDGSTRRAAEHELKKHQTAYIEAAEARAGRKLSVRELLQGGAEVKDTRPAREKIDTKSQPTRSDDDNPLAGQLAKLQAELASLPTHGHRIDEQRASLERRIHMLAPQVAAKQAEIQERKDREALMSSEPVTSALADAGASVSLIQYRRDVPQEFIARARQRREDLQRTGDHNAYWKATKAAERELAALQESRAEKIDAEAAKLREDAEAIRRGEAAE